MKIAYICNFSYPVREGVWNSVYNIAKYMLSRGHEIYIFSSNLNPAAGNSSDYEEFEGIKIHRFPVKFKIGSYGLFWNFSKKLEEIKPDLIHTHVFRNPHSNKALKIAKKLNIKCILTTHAPFVERKLRGFVTNLIVSFYDKLFANKILNSYNKVIAITRWEIPYLLKLGCKREKIVYIPNGVSEEFFKIKLENKKRNQVIYLGRISNIKNTSLLVEVAKTLPKISFKIIGPIEKNYLIKSESKNLEIINKIYDRKEQFKYLKESDIFVLTSKREGFPQALIEAMAAGKIVISSDILGAREVIENGKNGFIFKNLDDLKNKINYCMENYSKLLAIRKKARKIALNFKIQDINKKIEKLY